MQCFFTSRNSLKGHSRKNLNCQVHQDMKLNAGQKHEDKNIKTIYMIFMSSSKTPDQPQLYQNVSYLKISLILFA